MPPQDLSASAALVQEQPALVDRLRRYLGGGTNTLWPPRNIDVCLLLLSALFQLPPDHLRIQALLQTVD